MKQGTYILTFSGPDESRWGQPHFESIVYEKTTNSIRTLSIFDNNTTIADSEEYPVPKSDVVNSLIGYIPFWTPNGRDVRLKKTTLNCGQRYSGIYRPIYNSCFRDMDNLISNDCILPYHYSDPPIADLKLYINYLRQLELILEELHKVFLVVDPDRNNFKTYDNTIRNIIILACTEMDSLMRSILKENKYDGSNKQFTLFDYYCLLEPLRLKQYSLSLTYIQEVKLSPFSGWKPTDKSCFLDWYDAYNKIKHDRIKYFKKANISNALFAILGFATTLIAKYGYRNELWKEKIGKIILVDEEPQWDLKDFYIPPFNNENYQYVDYPLI